MQTIKTPLGHAARPFSLYRVTRIDRQHLGTLSDLAYARDLAEREAETTGWPVTITHPDGRCELVRPLPEVAY
jgi:hypothetical protein